MRGLAAIILVIAIFSVFATAVPTRNIENDKVEKVTLLKDIVSSLESCSASSCGSLCLSNGYLGGFCYNNLCYCFY